MGPEGPKNKFPWETDFKKVTYFLLYPIHSIVCLSHVLLLVVMLYVQYCEINIV